MSEVYLSKASASNRSTHFFYNRDYLELDAGPITGPCGHVPTVCPLIRN